MNPGDSAFGTKIAALLEAAQLWGAEFISVTPEPSFPYACAVFKIGPLVLKFVSDRGQEFIDVASSSEPEEFFQFDDIDIAMGWKTIDEVLSKREPEALRDILARLAVHRDELYVAFAGSRQRFKRASFDRGEARTSRLSSRKK